MEQRKKIGTFDIKNNISEHITLGKLMDLLGNVNNEVSVVGKWIFDSNNKNMLPLTIESLDLICACPDGYQ